MASHFQPATRPRSLANVLADLKEARDDLDQAFAAIQRKEPDADDRYTEAATRLEDLREEFEERFVETNGLAISDLWKARESALI